MSIHFWVFGISLSWIKWDFSLYVSHHLLWLNHFQSWVIFCRTGQAGMSRVESAASRMRSARPFLRQKKTFTTLYRTVHSFEFTITNSNAENNVYDRCRVCTFVFLNKKRNTNLNGEFLKEFEKGCNHNVRADYGLPRTMCDTCYYRVETMWKKATFVIPGHHLSKRISGNLFDEFIIG